MNRETYWKVQFWEQRSLAWIDVQRAHPSYPAADEARPAGKRSRVIEVTPKGRAPVPNSVRDLG